MATQNANSKNAAGRLRRLLALTTAISLPMLAQSAAAESTQNGDVMQLGVEEQQLAQQVTDRQLAQADSRDVRLEEIVVTATKTGERALQDVPAAITAFAPEQLQDRGIENLADLPGAAPNLNIGRFSNRVALTIRGIGSSNIFIGADPSSTVHIDGVYIARTNMVLTDFVDLERVEILRGPQGTLYGRNAVGGTINIVTSKPEEELRLAGSLEYGSFDRVRATASVSGPVIEDTLAMSIAGLFSTRDGYVENLSVERPDLSDEDIRAIRGALRYTPTDRFTFDLALDATRQGDLGPAYKPTGRDVLGNPSNPAFTPMPIDDFHTVNIDEETINIINNYGLTATIGYDFTDEITLTSITGARGMDQRWLIDGDYSELLEWRQSFWDSQHQISQEVQLNGDTGRFNWVAGVYYFHEKNDFNLTFDAFGLAPGLAINVDSDLVTNAYAVFAQTDIRITDQLNATIGGRYSHEKKTFDTRGFVVLRDTLAEIPVPGFTYQRDGDTESWGAFTPKFGLDYGFTDDALAYFSATRGFKSGGYNITGTEPAYDPEFIWAYEIGLKSTLADDRLQVNAAAFYYDYSDLQVQAFTPDGLLDITNAADSTIWGLELEVTALPTDNFQITVTGAYLDATYDSYTTARASAPDVALDLSGNRLNFSPEWQFSVFGEYRVPLAAGFEGRLQADFRWQDQTFFSAFNDPGFGEDSYGLLNAQAAVTSPGGTWELAVFARNLTDKEYTTGAYDFSASVSEFITEPRTFGVRLSYRN